MASEKSLYSPRVIIHGGAGNITRQNLPPSLWKQHQAALSSIVQSTDAFLKQERANALSAVVHAVTLLEQNPLYNAGVGAVFSRTGTIELEASVMVSHGKLKRGAAVSLIKHVKHPIQLAAGILEKGEEDDAGGAQGHVHLSGPTAEELASAWGLEMCEESHFWTRKRWEEHRRGLDHVPLASSLHTRVSDCDELACMPNGLPWPGNDPSWNEHDYLTQGTVGCVAMDRYGVVAVATSTGGITNKLPGRIGDTPTFGAGFWAEAAISKDPRLYPTPTPSISSLIRDFDPRNIIGDCLPQWPLSSSIRDEPEQWRRTNDEELHRPALGMSGTGNGDSFLRLSAVRTAAALVEFPCGPDFSLAGAVTWMAGPRGFLQRSAGDRWGKTGEGQGGIIGIGKANRSSSVVADFNCGGLFRAWIDSAGNAHCKVFRDED